MNDIDATIHQQLRSLRDTVEAMRSDILEAKKASLEQNRSLDSAQARIGSLERLLFGNPKEQYIGLVQRMVNVETIAEQMQNERKAFNNKLNGFAIGLGLNIAMGGGVLVAIIRLLTGGGG